MMDAASVMITDSDDEPVPDLVSDDNDSETESDSPSVGFVLGLESQAQDDIAEIFSPPRLTSWGTRSGLLRGNLAVDLETGWDLSCPTVRSQLFRVLAARRPRVLFFAPPCTWFSPLTRMWNKKRH